MNEIKIYKTPDGKTQVNVRFDKDTAFVYRRHSWLNYSSQVKLILANTWKIFLRQENWMKSQLFGISEQFVKREIEKLQGILNIIILM